LSPLSARSTFRLLFLLFVLFDYNILILFALTIFPPEVVALDVPVVVGEES